jgi:glycosyltransferase involved in cell wall biosynthesis
MTINLIFRKRNPIFFSIEKVFEITAPEIEKHRPLKRYFLPEAGVKFKNIFYLLKIRLQRSKNNLYHVTGDVHYAVFALPRRRTVLTIHDCVFLENHRGLKRFVLKKILLDWPVKYVAVVTAISEKTKLEIKANTGCKSDKVKVVSNPVSPVIKFSSRPFNHVKPVLLFLGSTANKNLDRAISAIVGLSCVLHIIGELTEAQISNLDHNGIDYIREKGLSETDLADRFSEADIIYFPSLYEGFGLPVLEGFKAGKAVLTSDISPMKEIAEGAAFLVNPYDVSSIRDGLLEIINNDSERIRKCEAGRKIALKYEPSNIAEDYIEVYKSIMD